MSTISTSPGTKKEEILLKATKLFKDRGYGSASMRMLATVTDIEAASIYSHFKSKEEILKGICFEMAGRFMEALDQAEIQASPEEKLRCIIRGHFEIVTTYSDATAVMWNEWKHLGDLARKEFVLLRRGYESFIEDVLVLGMHSGVFRKQQPAIATSMLLTLLNGISSWWNHRSMNDANLDQVEEFILGGLAIEQVVSSVEQHSQL